MRLTRNFLDTIAADLRKSREFRLAYLSETIENFHDGDLATGKGMLRDFINATLGFGALSKATDIPVKSLMRMLSRSGNPQADKLFAILSHVERLERVRVATSELDVTGSVVSPGFVDVHTHDDAALIARPEMTAKLSQGVTTVIAGNCGISAFPYARTGDPPDLLRLVFKSDRFVAPTFGDYLDKVRTSAPAVNAAFLTGHTTLRMQVMGEDLNRSATESEIRQMRDLLEESLREGSLGMSTGLFYPAARSATTREIMEVGQVLRDHQGIYTTHMRDEADGVVESLREAMEIGREIGIPVVISHHKCMGARNFGRSTETLALIAKGAEHQPISLDVYPYTACSTVLNEEMVSRSSKTLITWSDPYPQFCATDLDEVATMLDCSRDEAVRRLQPAGAIYFMMDEGDVQNILRFPGAMIGSDGLPEDQHPHPRLWGTFPRVLGRYVRELRVLTLEEAVHRMTALPAQRFGLSDRGRIEVGSYADVAVFDADTIIDTASYEAPVRAAAGISYVIVNGRMAWEKGLPTSQRAGKALLRGGSSS